MEKITKAEAVRAVISSLEAAADDAKPLKRRPCRLMVSGKFVTLNSGKSLWNQPGHAKTALRNHISATLGKHGLDWKEYREMVEFLMEDLFDSGAVKVIML